MAKKKPIKKTNNRPGQYDWFKTGTDHSNGSSPRATAKIIWKFIKIFLYISLFGFTMTGCVQSFVFKSDTNIGRSVEIYADEDEIAPHATTINARTIKHNSKDHIYLELTDATHWINKVEQPGILEGIREELKGQNAKNDLKLKDAWHGGNEVLRYTVDGQVDKTTDSIVQANGKPMVISSLSTKNNYTTATWTEVQTELQKYTILNKDSTKIEPIDFKVPVKNKYPTKYDQARDQFNATALKQLLAQPEVQEALTSKIVVTNPAKILTEEERIEYTRVSVNFAVLAHYFRITPEPDPKDNTATYWQATSGHMVGGLALSVWRPLVTWGDSWKLGPFYAVFVYPIGVITAKMIQAMPLMSGWESLITIFIIVFIIKALSFLITFKSILQQTKMQELSAKKAIIDAKYVNYKENKQMQQRKQQEIQALYKKEGISPLGSMGSMFVVMPLFLSILRVTRALPHLKASLWLGIKFGATSWKEVMQGEWQYLPLMLAAMAFAGVQQLLPRLLTKKRDNKRINVHQKEAMKKNNKMQNITIGVSIAASVIFSAGMQVYYLASGTWMIIQAFLTHHILVQQKKRRRTLKIKT